MKTFEEYVRENVKNNDGRMDEFMSFIFANLSTPQIAELQPIMQDLCAAIYEDGQESALDDTLEE